MITTDVPDPRFAVRTTIEADSRCDAAYLTMNALAAIIACCGLLESSPAVVIGAMIIAMLLGPISGVALGLVEGNDALLRNAFLTLLAGVAVVYATALVFGWWFSALPLTDQIYSRTSPNLMDLMIALAGGAAGAYAIASPRLNAAFVGVAISTALVPPLASSAICLVRGEYWLSAGALLLAFANVVGIQASSSLVLWLAGFRGRDAAGHRAGGLLKRSLVSVAILVAIGVVLTANLHRLILKESYEAAVRSALLREARAHQGAYLADVRFRREAGRTIVTAVYRTPVPFAPDQVAAIERTLPASDTTPELRIRSIPVTVASRGGYLYADQDQDQEYSSTR